MARPELPLRLVTADELGQIKVIQAPSLARLDELSPILRWGQPEKTRNVTALAAGSRGGLNDTTAAVLAVGRADGTLECINPSNGEILWTVPATDPTDAIASVHVSYNSSLCPSKAAAKTPIIISLTSSGTARVHASAGADGAAKLITSWKVSPTVCCSDFDESSGKLAVGSQGAELRVYDITAPSEPSYIAKGGKPNSVGLVDKPWNSAVAFIPGSNGTKIIVGTGYHKVRLYDSSIGKRPQINIPFGDATRITCLAPEPSGQRCWVANGQGQVEVFEFSAGKFVGGIKGIAGSVRSLAVMPGGKIIASVGLDRFLRLHDTATRKSVGKVYMKTQMTRVAFCPSDASMAVPEEKTVDLEVEEAAVDKAVDVVGAGGIPSSGKKKVDSKRGLNDATDSVARGKKRGGGIEGADAARRRKSVVR